jgi:hypothetical protein
MADDFINTIGPLSIIIPISVAYFLFNLERKSRRRIQKSISREVNLKLSSMGTSAVEILERKQIRPRVFYFLNEELALNLYAQLSDAGQEPEYRELESAEEREVRAELPIGRIKPSAGRKRGRVSRERFGPERDPARAMARVEQHLLDEDAITPFDLIALAYEEVNSNPFHRIEGAFEFLEHTTKFPIPEKALASVRQEFIEHQRNRRGELLATASGYVAIKGKYAVELDESGDLILSTPVTVLSDSSATIRILCSQESVRLAGRMAFNPGSEARATCLGKILRWDNRDRVLHVLPISIF